MKQKLFGGGGNVRITYDYPGTGTFVLLVLLVRRSCRWLFQTFWSVVFELVRRLWAVNAKLDITWKTKTH